ncbi:hypothetical protein [uncultured Polaribacter sp.]|uniref:hypothetical protein n=1 Tax=uncultured Polaribacter sp. TaxID=174711 RepID=UPI00259BA8FB|nr:hypothetical protein [uncultured Polaribacter sp.]
MQKIILYIQPQLRNTTTTQDFVRVDLMEEDLIELTQVIQDIKDIDKVFTDYSRTFNLPASKTNNKIFKHWYNPDIDGFDNQIISSARIELNHLEFKFGKVQLEEAVLKNGQPSMYKVTFFGNTISLKEIFKDDNLDALTWLNNFNHNSTYTNIKDGFSDGLDFTVDSVSYTDAVIYPLIAHTNPFTYSTSNYGHPDPSTQYNLAVTGVAIANRGVFPEDLKPAIPIKNIIKAIQQQYNLTIKSGGFFDSAALDGLYMWLHRNVGKMQTAGTWVGNSDAYGCTGTTCTELTDSTSAFGYFDLTTGVYLYKAALVALSDVTTIKLEITPASGFEDVEYTFDIVRVVNDESFTSATNQTGTQEISVQLGGTGGYNIEHIHWYQPNGTQFVGRVNSDDAFSFQAKFTIDRTVVFNNPVSPSNPTTYVFNGVFTSTSSSLSVTGGLVTITNQIPKMKVIDFLKGLFKMFNLTAFVDTHNNLVVKTLDDYYAGGDTHDITKYVKTDENTVGKTTPFKNINFQYPEAKTILAQEFRNINNTRFGSLEYESEIAEGSDYTVETPFSHMMFERITDIYESGSPSVLKSRTSYVQAGVSIDTDLKPVVDNPLIFYAVPNDIPLTVRRVNFAFNERPADGSLPTIDSGDSAYVVNTYFTPSNSSSLGFTTSAPYVPDTTNAPTYNINFGSEINSYSLTDYGGNNNSLFQLYYQNYITRVFNKRTRLFKFSAVLPLKVLLTLTLDDLIVVGTRAYTINKMSTKLQSGETNFELLNEPN